VKKASHILEEMQGSVKANESANAPQITSKRKFPKTRSAAKQQVLSLSPVPIKDQTSSVVKVRRWPGSSSNMIEIGEPQDLGFIARVFAQMGLPHSDPGDDVRTFERRNGTYRLKLTADEESHLPYGTIPRVLLAFVGTEAVRTKSREIYLGKNLSEFLRDKLHMHVSGGPRGTITAVREQAWRLFTCTVSVAVEDSNGDEQRRRLNRMLIAEDIELWWTNKAKNQETLWESRLELSQKFYDYLLENPVPIDWNAVRCLSRSSLALDLYFWLTHRMSYLRHQTTVPWFGPGSLFEQLGCDYNNDRYGRRTFKAKILDRLKKIQDPQVWPDCKVQMSKAGLVLHPSPTHIPQKLLN
jgi:Plasmid encoded RepA protein